MVSHKEKLEERKKFLEREISELNVKQQAFKILEF
jgi:hypothetical protein